VKAPAFTPLWLSLLMTRAFHGPVAARDGMANEQAILPAPATVTFVALMTE
jgi:hypothetical protein